MAKSSLEMDQHLIKVALKFAITTSGVQSVIKDGMTKMPVLSVVNLDFHYWVV